MVAGLVAIGLVALIAGSMWAWTAKNSRAVSRENGELKGKIDALRKQIDEMVLEREAMRIALARALDPAPTLDELDRVSALAAGSEAHPGAASAIDVP